MADPGLPTTSYAVLGMLALRSWTGYELTQQMLRSLDYCWPKAESVLYDEPRRLVSLGLARAATEHDGGRTRQRYSITARGRRALRAWLATEPAAPRLEIEPMLRLLFADQGDADDLRRAMAVMRTWSSQRYERGIEVSREHLEDGGPFPERRHLSALFAAFYAGLFHLIDEWTALVERELDEWPSTAGVGLDDGAREILERVVARQPLAR